jgi:hypothetical protein
LVTESGGGAEALGEFHAKAIQEERLRSVPADDGALQEVQCRPLPQERQVGYRLL